MNVCSHDTWKQRNVYTFLNFSNENNYILKRANLTGRELPEWKYIANCAINDVKSRIEPSKGDIDFNNYD